MSATRKNTTELSDNDEIRLFLDGLWVEDGLSDNTLAAYKTDLKLFSKWINPKGKTLLSCESSDVSSYLALSLIHI